MGKVAAWFECDSGFGLGEADGKSYGPISELRV